MQNNSKSAGVHIDFKKMKKDHQNFKLPKFLRVLTQFQRQIQNIDTQMSEITVAISTDQPIYIAFIGDLHLGAVTGRYQVAYKKFQLMREIPALYAINLGDTVDNFLPNAHPSGQFENLLSPKFQKLLVEEFFNILKGRWLAMINGDHENFSMISDDFNFAEYLANKMNCPNLGFGGVIHLRLGKRKRIQYDIAVRHRYRFNSSFNLTHTVKRMREQVCDFDVGAIAHGHQPAVEHAFVAGKDRIFIRTGAFKDADRYAQKLGWNGPAHCIIPVVKLYPKKRRMQAYFDVSFVAEELGISY